MECVYAYNKRGGHNKKQKVVENDNSLQLCEDQIDDKGGEDSKDKGGEVDLVLSEYEKIACAGKDETVVKVCCEESL